MADVVWHSKHTNLVETLTSDLPDIGAKVFERNRDLIKFAAMIGYKLGRKSSPDSAGKTIPLRIFESTKDDEIIFLVAMMASKDVNILRKDNYQDNENDAIKLFEAFANGGLDTIQEWLDENPIPGEEPSILLEKITNEMKLDLDIGDGQVRF